MAGVTSTTIATCGLEPERRGPCAVEADLLLHCGDRDDVDLRVARLGDPAGRLERDVRAETVVERLREQPVVRQLDRRSRPTRPRRPTRTRLSASSRLFAPMSRCRSASSSRGRSRTCSGWIRLREIAPGTRPFRVSNSKRWPCSVSAAMPPIGVNDEQPVLLDVRDRDADLVDVADDRKRRRTLPGADARKRRAERVGGHLREPRGRFPPDPGRLLLVTRRAGSGQERSQKLGCRHRPCAFKQAR